MSAFGVELMTVLIVIIVVTIQKKVMDSKLRRV